MATFPLIQSFTVWQPETIASSAIARSFISLAGKIGFDRKFPAARSLY
ncbi:hypothetical protein [Chroococcidiopsis sp. SAG 2025]|nr:hypothetical protein [Chroococcidiopsis sp. SAG 2025]